MKSLSSIHTSSPEYGVAQSPAMPMKHFMSHPKEFSSPVFGIIYPLCPFPIAYPIPIISISKIIIGSEGKESYAVSIDEYDLQSEQFSFSKCIFEACVTTENDVGIMFLCNEHP